MVIGKKMWLATVLAVATGAGCSTSNGDGAGGSGGTIDGGTGGTGGIGGMGGSGGAGGTGGAPITGGFLLGDGTPDAVKLFVIADAEDGLKVPRDLSFHPERVGEAWIISRADDSVVIVYDGTGPAVNAEWRQDGYAMHFMEEPASIDFGDKMYEDDYTFATCQESGNTYNGLREPNYFMGPALWTAHLDIFAITNTTGSGSHLDMLHESPFCMGVSHEVGNAYWVFDGHNGKIVRYDFVKEHPPGYDDHSDGLIRFLDEPAVKRVEDVPSHLVFDKATKQLYVADTGNARIVRIDTESGESRRKRPFPKERGTVVEDWQNVVWDEVVSADSQLLQLPSGIAMHDGFLYVSDNATGEILAFDLEGNLVNRFDTGAEPGGLMGLEVGPDDRLYFVDSIANTVTRIET